MFAIKYALCNEERKKRNRIPYLRVVHLEVSRQYSAWVSIV